MTERERLEQYEREQGVTPLSCDIAAGLRGDLTEVERRLVIHVATRAATLLRIVELDDPTPARVALGKLDEEITALSGRKRYLMGAVERAKHPQIQLSAEDL